MGWQEERQQYIDKLGRIVNGAGNLLALPQNRIVSSEMRSELEKLKSEASKLKRKLENNEFEIAVVGLEKAGKSSFANSLIQIDTLPTAGKRCTYTTTCIRSGDKNAATVTFFTTRELENDLRNKLDILKIPDTHLYNLINLDLPKYEYLYSRCSPEIRQLYDKTVNQDIRNLLINKESIKKYLNLPPRDFEEGELDGEEFKSFIKDPERALAAKEITIYATSLAGLSNDSKTVLYDVPGFDSPTDMHKKQTFDKMDSADVIIAVANAESPSLTSAALEVWTKTDKDDRALNEKLFVFANKLDRVQPADLEESKATTYQEWIQTWGILPARYRDRILFGSARAAIGDEDAREKLAALKMDDGLKQMWDDLEQYNRTARFEVLKARVGSILRKIETLFEPVNDFDAGDRNIFSDYGKILLELLDEQRKRLGEKDLPDYKDNLNGQMRSNKPLSNEIRKRIENLIKSEQYGVQEQELKSWHNREAGIGAAEQPGKVDGRLRGERFEKMYGDFCEQVQSVAAASHGTTESGVADIFLESLGLSKGHPSYDDMREKIIKFCNFDNDREEVYYSTLLERFARDLFEALIMYAHGSDRWNKFKEEQANFISMGVFFDSENIEGGELSANPADSLFWRLLLYPALSDAPRIEDIVRLIQDIAGLANVGTSTRALIGKAIIKNGPKLTEILTKRLGNLPQGRNEAVQSADVKKVLESLAGTGGDASVEENYLDYVHDRHRNYTYETVKEEFDEDIGALRRVLVSAFIPAVNIDKAFAARESRLIEQIIQKVLGPEFHDFLALNVGTIRAAQIGELEAEQAQRQADEAVVREIKGILAGIESGSK